MTRQIAVSYALKGQTLKMREEKENNNHPTSTSVDSNNNNYNHSTTNGNSHSSNSGLPSTKQLWKMSKDQRVELPQWKEWLLKIFSQYTVVNPTTTNSNSNSNNNNSTTTGNGLRNSK